MGNRWSRAAAAGAGAALVLLSSCTVDEPTPPVPPPVTAPEGTTGTGSASTLEPSAPPTSGTPKPPPSIDRSPASVPPTTTPTAAPFHTGEVMATIEHLAGLGPREATGPAFGEAADWVAGRFEALGYTIATQSFEVPAGNSWGVAVPAGTSRNVVADPPGFDHTAPHLIVGAHLDSVPQSPGAEDNASGVAVMLELARMVAEQPGGLPVRFIAFGAEEPRSEGDDWHHYGSQHYVAGLGEADRAAIVAMVALDRVGVPGDAVPVGAGGAGTTVVREQLVAAAGGLPVVVDEPNRASDHWSFDKAGIPAARLGSIPFAGYHSPGDTPDVVDEQQLGAVGGIMWNWLQAQPL